MTINIPVTADLGTILKKIEAVGAAVDKINRKTVKPINPADTQRDFDKVERQYDAMVNRIKQPRGRRRGAGDADFPVPGASEEHERARYGIRKRYTYAPEMREIPQAALSGVGGGFGQIAGHGARGAIAGASEGGGMLGGVAGLLRGTAIGALVYGAFKAGSAVSEGIDMARDRAGTLDTLKRQMGDVGVSFERLKISSDSAAWSLGLNSKDFAALERQINVASRGADRSPGELGASANLIGGFARSYGIDPSSAAGIFGNARNIDPKSSYRQFALILAETIDKSSMASRAEDVMQAISSFATLTSRMSLSSPNIAGFAGAYTGMVNSGITGLTPEAASQMLTQANAATMNMGAAGEAGQAFTLAALQRSGRRLNPLETSAQASGGLFATRSSIFGPGSAMAALLGNTKLATGGDPNKTNLQMIMEQSSAMTGRGQLGKEFQAELLQRYFGLQSIQQGAAFAALKPAEIGGLGKLINESGLDPTKLNTTNIQTLARIGDSHGMGDLDKVYADMRGRTGSSALTAAESSRLAASRATDNPEEFRKALIDVAGPKDYAQDTFTVARSSQTTLETIQTTIGDHLLPTVTQFKDDMVTLLGGHKALDEGQRADALYMNSVERADIYKHPTEYGSLSKKDQARLDVLNRQDDSTRSGGLLPSQPGSPGNPIPSNAMLPEVTVHAHTVVNVDKHGGATATTKATGVITRPKGSGTQ